MSAKLYSLKQVAAKLEVHSATVVRWIESRRVSVKKKKNRSGHYVFTDEDVAELVGYKTSVTVLEP